MKTVLLAGGPGPHLARLADEIHQPMVEIGPKPLLWHIMKSYGRWRFEEFIVALGYRQDAVKSFILNLHHLSRNLTVEIASGAVQPHQTAAEPWTVHLMDTGEQTKSGGRLRRLRNILGRETFMLNYGDAVSDVDLRALLDFHRVHGRLATIIAVRPPARFGSLAFDGDLVAGFDKQTPPPDQGWINGGYMVLEPGVFEYIQGDDASLENETLARLAGDGQVAAYRHHGFWHGMDTPRDVQYLRGLYESGAAPWLRHWDRRSSEIDAQSAGPGGARVHWLDPESHAGRKQT